MTSNSSNHQLNSWSQEGTWNALLWEGTRKCLSIAMAFGLAFAIANCGSQDSASVESSTDDPCNARFAPKETIRVLSTTGQIGDVVSMIAGLKEIDPTLWSETELASRSSWKPVHIEENTAVQNQQQQIEPANVIIEVDAMLGPGTDPHLFRPTLSDAHALNEADIIFYNGLHLEAQMLKAMAELAKTHCVVAVGDVQANIPEMQDLLIYSSEGVVDPHIWNSPTLWVAATRVMAESLEKGDSRGTTGIPKQC